MDVPVQIRPAEIGDEGPAVELIYATMHPIAAPLLGMGDVRRAKQFLAGCYRREDNRFSYRLAEVAVIQNKIAGLLLSFPGRYLSVLSSPMGAMIGRSYGLGGVFRSAWYALPMLFSVEAKADEYLISHLAVAGAFRRRGLGRQLLERAEQRALGLKLKKCALEVDLDNEPARTLYLSCGYQVVSTVRSAWLKRYLKTDGYDRMVKNL